VALARAVLKGLRARRAFGWPEDASDTAVDPAECAAHFGMDKLRWANVCVRSANFYERTAFIHYDPRPPSARAPRYWQAVHALMADRAPEQVGIPGLGARPVWVPFQD